MAPKWTGSEWVTTKPELEGPEAGYPATRTLLRHGPKAFLIRTFQPDKYEQAVLKFMAVDKVDRDEAQGNMDAYFENPNDWAYDRMQFQKTGRKVDYVSPPEGKTLALVLVWSTLVLSVTGRVAYSLSNHVSFWAFGPFQ